ncbi:MAG: recombinase family protein [Terriglobales bacterium]
MTKVYGYLRVSSPGQAKDGRDGFVRQKSAISAWARSNNAKVAGWFQEPAKGTTNIVDRPAFAAMMEKIFGNGVRTVVVERLDRLARDLMVQESIIADFRKRELTLISTAEPDLAGDDPSRVAMRQMMGVFAQYERATLVFKLRAARQRQRLKNGRCEGRKPYGTRPGERETIERMFAIYEEGAGWGAIANQLNSDKVPTRTKGGRWHPMSVRRILMSSDVHRLTRMTGMESAFAVLRGSE